MKFIGIKEVLIEWRAYLICSLGKEGTAVLPVPDDPNGDAFFFEVDLTDMERLMSAKKWIDGGYVDRLEFIDGGMFD